MLILKLKVWGVGSCGCFKSTPLIKEGSDEPCGFNVDSVLPEGFRERTKCRGLVVQSWVLQLEMLKKESVCGFVPHNGWNSVLSKQWLLECQWWRGRYMPSSTWIRNAFVEEMKLAIPVVCPFSGFLEFSLATSTFFLHL